MGLLKVLFSSSYRKGVSQEFVKVLDKSEEELEEIYLKSMDGNKNLLQEYDSSLYLEEAAV